MASCGALKEIRLETIGAMEGTQQLYRALGYTEQKESEKQHSSFKLVRFRKRFRWHRALDVLSPINTGTHTRLHFSSRCHTETMQQPEVAQATALEERYAASLAQSNGATLDLSSLRLTELPPLDELAQRFPRLSHLNIRRNALRSLPDGLARAFPQLSSLNASENALEELPASSIGALRYLQRLNVAHNRLGELSIATFERHDALEELDARGNLIEKISFDNLDEKLPVGAGLRKLQVLLLADNRLRLIDPTTTDVLPKLRVIDLSGNPEL